MLLGDERKLRERGWRALEDAGLFREVLRPRDAQRVDHHGAGDDGLGVHPEHHGLRREHLACPVPVPQHVPQTEFRAAGN